MMERSRLDRSPYTPLIFLHVPKTAGATLRQVLLREYGRRYSFALDGSKSRLQEFIAQPPGERMRIKLLHGHMPFGLHRYLSDGATYVTFVRNPLERVLSHYEFVVRRPDHHLHRPVRRGRLGPAELLASGLSTQLDNGQVRLLAGPPSSDVAFGECGDDLLQTALQNIQRQFSIVGIPERFDETLLLMHDRLHWRKAPYYASVNVSRRIHSPLSDRERAVIEAHNKLDQRLYEVVQERLSREIEEQGDRFTGELSRFRRVNQHWAKLMWPERQFRALNRHVRGSHRHA